ncbi:MAG: acyltransferase [Dysgonamonadaceae bacterium]|jgi:peptidoglycan/LPS O-acetylase OafA/YrhL|nr:acyltransferase [Dysgonamonadaceae bacterium]
MQRNLSIDILKIVMAFLVVGLHGRIFLDYSYSMYYLFVQGFTRLAVPTFLIISGYYFYDIQTKETYHQWIKRLFYLYAIWTIIYSPCWFVWSYRVLLPLFLGYWHLWYLIGALYAFVLVWWMRRLSPSIQTGMMITCALIGLFLQYNYNYGFTHQLDFLYRFGNRIYMNGLFQCLPFILMGYLIRRFSLDKKKMNEWLWLAVALLYFVAEVAINYRYNGKDFDLLFNLYLLCPVLFLFCLNRKIPSNNKTLALYSTGIYLTHAGFLIYLRKYVFLTNTPYIFVCFVLSVIVTFLLIKLKKKFKYIL